MPRKKKTDTTAAPMFDVKTTTAPCVPAIRERVDRWRATGYEGASDTTRRLLNFWFHTDHRLPNGRKFAYHYSQQHALETLIYLYEVAKVRRQKDLVETYANRQDLKLLQYDDFARYCVKMATGSGKTKVMSLALAWQYFNAVAEARDDYAKTFLILAPNVIVLKSARTGLPLSPSAPVPEKLDKDIAVPQLSPILTRKKSLAEEIAALNVEVFDCPILPRKKDDKAAEDFRYEGYDLVTLEKIVERDYTIPEPQTAEEVIGYYARRIAQEVKLPSQFAA